MPYKRKTWREKLDGNRTLPKTLSLQPNFPCYRALRTMGAQPGDSVVLAPALEVAAIMKTIPEGKLITLREICEALARSHGAQYCCTLTTGIAITIAANAAEETRDDTPYWRTLKNHGELNRKYPGGVERQRARLEREGYIVVARGRRLFVEDFDQSLVTV